MKLTICSEGLNSRGSRRFSVPVCIFFLDPHPTVPIGVAAQPTSLTHKHLGPLRTQVSQTKKTKPNKPIYLGSYKTTSPLPLKFLIKSQFSTCNSNILVRWRAHGSHYSPFTWTRFNIFSVFVAPAPSACL